MTMITYAVGSYPSTLQGKITFASGSGTFTVGEIVTGTGFSAKVVKWIAATKELTVKRIAGNPTAGDTLTGGDSSATGVVDTITSRTVGTISAYTGGWNLRETTAGITRSKIVGSRYLVEVMIADSNLSGVRTDFAVVATISLTGGAWSAASSYDISNGESLTFTVISSEPINVPAGTTFPVTVGGVSRTATFTGSNAAFTTHTFAYPVVTGDIGTNLTIAVSANNLTLPAGKSVYEIADNGSQKALTAPVAIGGTLADKTGVTIAA